jgi:hypothetical protein
MTPSSADDRHCDRALSGDYQHQAASDVAVLADARSWRRAALGGKAFSAAYEKLRTRKGGSWTGRRP